MSDRIVYNKINQVLYIVFFSTGGVSLLPRIVRLYIRQFDRGPDCRPIVPVVLKGARGNRLSRATGRPRARDGENIQTRARTRRRIKFTVSLRERRVWWVFFYSAPDTPHPTNTQIHILGLLLLVQITYVPQWHAADPFGRPRSSQMGSRDLLLGQWSKLPPPSTHIVYANAHPKIWFAAVHKTDTAYQFAKFWGNIYSFLHPRDGFSVMCATRTQHRAELDRGKNRGTSSRARDISEWIASESADRGRRMRDLMREAVWRRLANLLRCRCRNLEPRRMYRKVMIGILQAIFILVWVLGKGEISATACVII